MKKWKFVPMMLALSMIVPLSGCGVKKTLETVEDEMPGSQPYAIVFGVPEGVTQETFGDDGRCSVYESDTGDYTITTEVMDATTVEEAMETLSGFPADRLTVLTLNRYPMEEYHFAWASSGDEGDTVSRCALIAGEDYYYAMTMTEKAGLGTTYDETADYVFSTFGISSDDV